MRTPVVVLTFVATVAVWLGCSAAAVRAQVIPGCGGLLQPPCPAPTPSPTPTPTPAPSPTPTPDPLAGANIRVSLTLQRGVLTWPRRTLVRAKVSGIPAGVPGLRLVIEPRAVDYKNARLATSERTVGRNGTYSFAYTHGVRTRYVAQVFDAGRRIATSQTRTVRYFPNVDLHNSDNGDGRLQISLVASGPETLPRARGGTLRTRSGTGKLVYFYAGGSRGSVRRIKTRRLSPARYGGRSATIHYPFSRLPRRGGIVFACFRGTALRGGEAPFTNVCGRRTLRLR